MKCRRFVHLSRKLDVLSTILRFVNMQCYLVNEWKKKKKRRFFFFLSFFSTIAQEKEKEERRREEEEREKSTFTRAHFKTIICIVGMREYVSMCIYS